VVGYTANCLRKDSDKSLPCHNYVLNYAFLACVEIFKAEGNIEFAALGVAYGADVQGERGDSTTVRMVAQWAYKNMSRFYNLKALAHHKDLYKANRQPKLYACHKGPYSKLVYLIMPYIASEAIPHLSTGLFGKGTFIHKHKKEDVLLLIHSSPSLHQEDEPVVVIEQQQQDITTPTTTTTTTTNFTSSPVVVEVVVGGEEEEKKPKWQPKQRDGPKMTKRQRKRLEKQQKHQGEGDTAAVATKSSKESTTTTTTTTTTITEPNKPFQLLKAATSSLLHSLSHHKDSFSKAKDEKITTKTTTTTTTYTISKKLVSSEEYDSSESQKTLSLEEDEMVEEIKPHHQQLADLVVMMQQRI